MVEGPEARYDSGDGEADNRVWYEAGEGADGGAEGAGGGGGVNDEGGGGDGGGGTRAGAEEGA